MNLSLKITVIVPVYKIKKEYLIKCLDSLSNQTADKSLYEVILVDDNNNEDECGAICDEYALNNTNFRVFHQINQGVSVARNLGITESKAPYLAFVDADDWVELNMIEIMLKAQEECADADLICFAYYKNYKNKQMNPCINLPNKILKENIDDLELTLIYPQHNYLDTHMIGREPWRKLYKKNNIIEHKKYFIPNVKKGQDVIFNLYFLQTCKKIYFINTPIYHYNFNNLSVSNKPNTNIMQLCKDYNDQILLFIQSNNKPEQFFDYVNRNIFMDIVGCYRCYFQFDSFNKRKEYRNLLSSAYYQNCLNKLNFPSLDIKEKLFFFIIKTKNLMLFKFCYSIFKLIKR